MGGGTSCAQRTSLMLLEKPSKLGFLQNPHPLWDITGYHPNYFLLGFRATPSIPTLKRSKGDSLQGPPRASRVLQGPPGTSRGSRLEAPPNQAGLQGPPLREKFPGLGGPRGCLERVQTQAFLSGKSMYLVYIWVTGVAGGRAVPPDVREEPGGALDVHSPEAPPLV